MFTCWNNTKVLLIEYIECKVFISLKNLYVLKNVIKYLTYTHHEEIKKALQIFLTEMFLFKFFFPRTVYLVESAINLENPHPPTTFF